VIAIAVCIFPQKNTCIKRITRSNIRSAVFVIVICNDHGMTVVMPATRREQPGTCGPETFTNIIKTPKTFLVFRLNNKLQSRFPRPEVSADCGPGSRVQSYTQ